MLRRPSGLVLELRFIVCHRRVAPVDAANFDSGVNTVGPMEDASRFALRERKATESLTVIPAPTVLPWEKMPREPHLLDYLIILRKHQWLILTFLLTVVTVVTIASFKMKPVYEAAARVEVDKESSQNTLPFQDANAYDEYVDMDTYLETQTKILESETLAFQTIKSMDLERYPEFGGTSGGCLRARGAGAKRPAILGAFLGGLSVKRVPEQPANRSSLRSPGSAARCADCECAFAELHRSRISAANMTLQRRRRTGFRRNWKNCELK